MQEKMCWHVATNPNIICRHTQKLYALAVCWKRNMQSIKPDGKNINIFCRFACIWILHVAQRAGKTKANRCYLKLVGLARFENRRASERKKKRNDICYVFISNFMRVHVFHSRMTGFMFGYVIVTLVAVAVCAACYYHFFLSFFYYFFE